MEDQDSASERLAKVDSILDEYEKSIGLHGSAEEFHDDSVKAYIKMGRQELEKITVEECAEAAVALGSFSFHLQRSYNREVARVNWSTSCMKSMVSGKEGQYSGSWDSQYHQAVKDNGYSFKLLKIQRYAQQRADRLTYLSTSMKNLSDLFVNMQKAKAGRRND